MTPRSRTVALPGWQTVEPWQVLAIDRVRDDSSAWGAQGRMVQEWFDRGDLEFETARAAADALGPEPPRGVWQWLRSALYGEPGPTLDLAALEG
jgi:hypothetical protein